MVRELMISEPEPSLLKVLHAKSFPPLCSFDHEPGHDPRTEERRDKGEYRLRLVTVKKKTIRWFL